MNQMFTSLTNYYNNRKQKKSGLGLQIDVVMWIVVVLIIVAIVMGVGYQLRESTRIASTKLEMDQIRQGVTQYMGLRADGAPPENLEILLNNEAVPAADSIDGIAHGPFIPTTSVRWNYASGPIVDLWDNAYYYESRQDPNSSAYIITIVSSAGHTTGGAAPSVSDTSNVDSITAQGYLVTQF
ncbi:MAG: hypothetical protein IKN43_07010 [Selenomonadaceae bacterium]|nr:hypothetical protein [Selenomonadaceae bacterium]